MTVIIAARPHDRSGPFAARLVAPPRAGIGKPNTRCARGGPAPPGKNLDPFSDDDFRSLLARLRLFAAVVRPLLSCNGGPHKMYIKAYQKSQLALIHRLDARPPWHRPGSSAEGPEGKGAARAAAAGAGGRKQVGRGETGGG